MKTQVNHNRGIDTHEDDFANDEESVTQWLRDNGFEKQQSEYASV